LHFQKSLTSPFRFRSHYRSWWWEKFSPQVFFRNCESQHISVCIPSYWKRTSPRPIVIDEIEKCYSGETSTAPSLRSISFKRIGTMVFLLDRLNTNRVGSLVPQQQYERFLVLTQHFRAAVVDRKTPIVGNSNFRCSGSHEVSGKDLKWHSSPLRKRLSVQRTKGKSFLLPPTPLYIKLVPTSGLKIQISSILEDGRNRGRWEGYCAVA